MQTLSKFALALALCAYGLSPLKSLAGDSTNLSCFGFISVTDGSNPPAVQSLTVTFFDHRSGAAQRRIDLGTVQNGKLITARIIVDDPTVPNAIKLSDGQNTIFDGTVQEIDGGIVLSGNYLPAGASTVQKISAVLKGSDIAAMPIEPQ